jgi:hypothetical protein
MPRRLLFAAAFACWSALAPAAVPPLREVTAQYDVYRNGVPVAAIRERFEAKDGAYRIVSESATTGIAALLRRRTVTLASEGRLRADGLQPERFEGRNSDGAARGALAEFDWAASRLTLSHDGRSEAAALPAGTQDRLSLMYQFLFLELERARQFEVPMTNGRKIDRYRYDITPQVEIDTPLGRLSTLHLVKRREAGESATEIWLAPQWRNFPVKVLIVEEDGVRYEQFITRLEMRP